MTDSANSGGKFDIPGMVTVGEGEGGLAKITVLTGERGAWSHSMAEIYTLGATVTRFDRAGRRLLFCSRTSKYAAGKAIRGGVPIIFPWFGPHPTDAALPQHGFARTADWTLTETRIVDAETAAVTLTLESSDATRAVFPYEFLLRYTVTVGRRMEMELEVTNRSDVAFAYEEALHTYFSVGDVRLARITGLAQTTYVDKVAGGARNVLATDPFVLAGETDRVFLDTTATCRIADPVTGGTDVSKSGSLSTVVWNPWQAKAEAMTDLAGDQWPGFVCVESANAMQNAVRLAAGASHTLRTVVESVD